MSAVLRPLLGFELALERANNIAQVLVFTGEDPTGVALAMLRGVGLEDPRGVAEELARAWHQGVREAAVLEAERAA
jgi:hypothetical protein